jgi:hypothetical protein
MKNRRRLWTVDDYQLEAAGELAFAKTLQMELILGFQYEALYQREGQLFDHIVVRTYTSNDAQLVVYADDRDDQVFGKVIQDQIHKRQFVVNGWIKGKDAKQQNWWRECDGMKSGYYVPQVALKQANLWQILQRHHQSAEPNHSAVLQIPS